MLNTNDQVHVRVEKPVEESEEDSPDEAEIPESTLPWQTSGSSLASCGSSGIDFN